MIALGVILLDLLGTMSAVTVSSAFFACAGLAVAYITGRTDEKAGEWSRRGAAAGFFLGLGISPFVFIQLTQVS
jgi:hypothetical protein